jgi:hypothetical protein
MRGPWNFPEMKTMQQLVEGKQRLVHGTMTRRFRDRPGRIWYLLCSRISKVDIIAHAWKYVGRLTIVQHFFSTSLETDAGTGMLLDLNINDHTVRAMGSDLHSDWPIPSLYPMVMAIANSNATFFRMMTQFPAEYGRISWENVDGDIYGNRGFDEFIFETGLNDTVQSVYNLA